MGDAVYTLVIAASDPNERGRLGRLVDAHPRFSTLAVAANPSATVDIVPSRAVDVALLVDEAPGLRGRDIVADLERISPGTRVVMTTRGDRAAVLDAPNVAAVLPDRDLDAVRQALDHVAAWFDDPTAVATSDKRVRADRRRRQDWSKVFAERRRRNRRG